MKRIASIAGVVFVAALALSAVAVSSASANLPLKCYKVSHFEIEKLAGNFKDAACKEEVKKLTGEYVLAEPINFKTENLWCAEITQKEGKEKETGNWKNNKCTEAGKDGKFIEVIVLPDISIALGGSYPLHLNFEDNKKTVSSLETTGGSLLKSKSGLLVLFLISELSALGTFDALFLKVEQGTQECHSVGDSEGTVLLTGEFHVVLGPSGLEALLLISEFEIICGKVKVKVKGSLLSTLSAGTEAEELTETSSELKGKAGKPTLTKYYNDEGKTVEALLLSNFGTGFLESDENVEEPVTLKVLESKMFTITGR